MRTILALCVGSCVGIMALVGCDGPSNSDEPCTNVGGQCQDDTLACAESFPYPCANPQYICCRPSKNPRPSATPTPTSAPAAADAAAE